MKQVQRGFTLIELVMVIVILGILAAVALPKFVDLKADAATAGNAGVAGALASASAINYAAQQLTPKKGTPGVLTCAAFAGLLQDGALPSGYTVTGTDATAAGATTSCTVARTDSSGTSTAVVLTGS